ncbi:MAG: serine/threonine-protein phosphatase [Bacteroidales bacterium]|nr:serine/threonine-protein phosphatase [Bacteroidales bacterium]
MLTIVFISLTVILAVIALIQHLTINRRITRATRKTEERYKTEIKNFESDIDRLNYLLEEKKSSENTQKTLPQKENQTKALPENFVLEQKKLEHDKEEIVLKNKKLWEMSVLIQKEKNHIQLLKNDIENKHRNITDSIKYAKRIQDAILPKEDVLRDNLSGYFLFWLPKETVSGDFYWMKRQGDLLIFTVADCTGHGVPGAFMSMMGVTFLNEVCTDINDNTQPSQILEDMRGLVISTLKQDSASPLEPKDGMDMALCILNLKTKKIRFSGANNPMYLVRKGELKEFKAIKNPIGQYPRLKPFETEEFQAEHGDYIYMFSDGFADQFNGETGKKVTYGRLKNLLTDINIETDNPKIQKQKLLDFITAWRGNFVQMDDILIGGYRI